MEGRPKRHITTDRDYRERKKLKKDEKAKDEDEGVQTHCRQLYKDIKEYKDPEDEGRLLCELFLQLPSKRLYPDYYEIIKHPIAFSSMKAKMDKNQYVSLAEFKTDIDHMVNNAKKYNIKESQAYQDAILIQKFVKAWQPGETLQSESPPSGERKAMLKLPGGAFGSRAVQPSESKIKAIRLKAVDKPAKKAASVKSLVDAINNQETKKALDLLESDPSIDPNELVKAEMFDDTFTWGPLHAAAYQGDVKVCQALIKHGANVELNDTWYSATPLGWAAFGDKDKVVRLLIEKHHAKKTAKNVHGQVPFDVVSDKEDPRWVGLLTGPYPGEKSAGVTPPKPEKLALQPPPPPPPLPQPVYKPAIQPTHASFQPPRKRRGRPPKCETDIQLQRPIEEIDINTFDPTVFGDLFTKIRRHTDNSKRIYSEIFEHLPDPDEYPDYYKQIEHPKSLAEIDKKMRSRSYANLKEWMNDMVLVFDNAMEYNEQDSRVYRDAKLLKRYMLREKERTMAKEGVAESQDDEAMNISLVGLPFHEDDKPSKVRTSSNKARIHSVERDQPPVMFQPQTPFFNFQNPIAAAAQLQPFLGTEPAFSIPPTMGPVAAPLPLESFAIAATPIEPSPSPQLDPNQPLSTASPEFFQLFSHDIQQVRLLEVLELSAADPQKMFLKKLGGDQIGHSFAVPSQVDSLRIVPCLRNILRTDSQRLTVTVLQNNRRLDMVEGGLGAQDELPCWKSDKLSLGLNSFKISITANVTRLDGNMQPEYKTQVYYLFIMQV